MEAWRREYNESRPHRALGERTPYEFAHQIAARRDPMDLQKPARLTLTLVQKSGAPQPGQWTRVRISYRVLASPVRRRMRGRTIERIRLRFDYGLETGDFRSVPGVDKYIITTIR